MKTSYLVIGGVVVAVAVVIYFLWQSSQTSAANLAAQQAANPANSPLIGSSIGSSVGSILSSLGTSGIGDLSDLGDEYGSDDYDDLNEPGLISSSSVLSAGLTTPSPSVNVAYASDDWD
jgi:hypothetical protein